MAQVTIYLDEEVLQIVKAAVRASGQSQSQWIADAVRLRARREWPESVKRLAGSWTDFPDLRELRGQGVDAPRETL